MKSSQHRSKVQPPPPALVALGGPRALRLLLFATLALSLALRCYGLGRQGLECEELYTVPAATGHQYVYLRAEPNEQPPPVPLTAHEYRQLLTPEAGHGLLSVTGVLARNVHMPLYFFFMHYWVSAFGTSEWALRLPSVIFSTLAGLLLFLLGRALFDAWTGLIAALLFGLMPEQIHFAQQARMYPLLVLLAVASTYALALARQRPRAHAPYVVYALTSVAGLYTHYEYVFFLAAQAFYIWCASPLGRERKRAWLVTQASVALALCPWLVVSLTQRRASAEVIAWAHGDLSAATLGAEVLSKLTRLISVPEVPFGWLSALAAYGLLAAGVLALRAQRGRLMLLCAWLAFPLAGVLLLDHVLATRAISIMRYWLLVTPALYLLMAAGVLSCKRAPRRLALVAPLAGFLCLTAFWTARGELRKKPDRHRELARFMDQQLAGTTRPTILTEGVNAIPLALAYYGRGEARVLRYKWVADRTAQQSFSELTGDAQDVWLLVSGDNQSASLLEANGFHRSSVQVLFGHILVSRYSRQVANAPPPGAAGGRL
jgi:uncharacterized membrane protein